MSNTRKLKKRIGGADTIYICKVPTNCIKELQNEFGLQFINVGSDGNCFFYTLEEYYKRKGKIISYKQLREQLVEYLLSHKNEYVPFGISEDDIKKLKKDGTWNLDIGDFVVPGAASAFQIKIKLYDLKPATKTLSKRIILYTYPEEGKIPKETISILRINGNHFGLLVPIKPNNNKQNNKQNNTKKNNKFKWYVTKGNKSLIRLNCGKCTQNNGSPITNKGMKLLQFHNQISGVKCNNCIKPNTINTNNITNNTLKNRFRWRAKKENKSLINVHCKTCKKSKHPPLKGLQYLQINPESKEIEGISCNNCITH